MEFSTLKRHTLLSKFTLAQLYTHHEQAPFDQLLRYLNISTIKEQTLSADLYNQLFQPQLKTASVNYKFVDQNCLNNTDMGYEEFIFKNRQIPSRPNWHDFFNATIWSQFPLTKKLFNELHLAEIHKEGKPRTAIRDKLTHFDECGIVIFTDNSQYPIDCANHHWQTLFVENKKEWGKSLVPVIFGHAIWEMLLNPYIGLTGKVRFVEVTTQTLNTLRNDLHKRYKFNLADQLLLENVLQKKALTERKPWLPLPLLGIPNWSIFTQDHTFYNNTNYFMPLRKQK